MSATAKALAITNTWLPTGACLHPSVHGPDGDFQVAAGPVGEFQRDDSLGAAVNIILGNELKGQFGVFHRVGQVALHLGVVGAGQGNVPRQGLELRLVRCASQGAARRFAGGFRSFPAPRHPKRPSQAGRTTRAGSE